MRRPIIRVRLLGTAAGGGLPQWNCSCPQCCLARQGKIPARTQSGVAISADGGSWYLINASPDLRAQIESFAPLRPRPESARNSPIAGVLLTNADLDHVLGLFLLREAGRLRIFSPQSVLEVLASDLRLTEILRPSCKIECYEPPYDGFAPLPSDDGAVGDLRVRAIPLSAQPPPYSSMEIPTGPQSVAYEITDERTKGRLVVAPDVAEVRPELRRAMEAADAVLFDGTFWSELEFQGVTGRKRTAADMGHLPIETGSLDVLRALKARHKIYFHINNTNPILALGSKERAAVEKAGVMIGEDGFEFEL
jgi:pyrroloquinoline quinone biosynthesis protein B